MNKAKLWMFMGIAFVVLLVGIISFRLGKQSAKRLNLASASPESSQVAVSPSSSPSAANSTANLEKPAEKLVKITTPIFFIKSNPTSLTLKPVLCEIVGEADDLPVLALKRLFTGPSSEITGLQQVFNKDTKVLSFSLKDKLAVVNFNSKIKEINVGASGEALVIAAIVNTLTKIPDIDQVKIQVEGEYIETLAGHVELMDNKFSYDPTDVEN